MRISDPSGQWSTMRSYLDSIIDAADRLPGDLDRGWAYLSRGILLSLQSSFEAAQADYVQAQQLFASAGDTAYQGVALARRGSLGLEQGQLGQARQ